MQTNKLTSLQLELLRVYSFNPNDEDLQYVRSTLGKYFANKLTQNVDKAVLEHEINENEIEKWLNE